MAITIIALLVLGALAGLLMWACPVTLRRVAPHDSYLVAQKGRSVPVIDLSPRPVYFIKASVLDKLYSAVDFADRTLTRAHIDYWITCGTLLGAVRHRGLIPWDDEVDISIRLEDVGRLLELRPEIESNGFRLLPARGGFKLGHRNWLTTYPYVDIIVVAPRDGQWSPCFPMAPDGSCSFEVAEQWPNECLPTELVYPLQRIDFEGLRLSCPARALDAAQLIYGPRALCQVPGGGYPRLPWIDNHYLDNVAFSLGLIRG